MISTTRRSPNATLVTKSAIDQASEALQDLPEKTKEKLSLREAVDVLRDHITAALDKGYSYEDIAVMLAKQGVSIAPSSLKHYLARSNRQLKAKGGGTQIKRRRSSKNQDDESAIPAEQAELIPSLEVVAAAEEAPKRGRRGSSKSAAAEPKTTTRSTSRTKSVAASASSRKRRGKGA